MIIGVNGFGFSGSGAVLDLLKEYSDVSVFDDCEMSICYYPDGILDLDYHLNECFNRYMNSDAAIYNFLKMMKIRFATGRMKRKPFAKRIMELTYNYIDSITQVSWKGTWGYRDYSDGKIESFFNCYVLQRISLLLNRLFKVNISLAKKKNLRMSIKPQDFVNKTKKYLIDVLKAVGLDTNTTFVFDQIFPASNPASCFKYFDCSKAILVLRDPVDTYLLAKKVVKIHSTWIPTNNVSDFVNYYKAIYESIVMNSGDTVMLVHYEDLIYNYEKEKKRIEDFCGVSNHSEPKKFFDPDYSIRYTQLFLDYPELIEDVEYIRKNLAEFLFEFPSEREKKKGSGKLII